MVIAVWEQILVASRDRMQLPQQRPALARQEHVMIDLARVDLALPHLHALPGDHPFFMVEVDFAPWRFRQLTGAHKHQQHQAGEYPRRGRHVDFILCQDAEEFRQFIRRDRRVMSSWRWSQRAAQAGHRVVFGHARGDGVAEYLSAYLRLPSRHLDCAAPFDLPEHVENDGGLEFLDGVLADQGEYILFQPVQDIGGRPGLPRVDLVPVPFAGNGLERVGGLDCFLPLLDAPGQTGVGAVVEQPACRRAFFPRLCQRRLWVAPERERLARPGVPVIHAPVFGAVGVDQQVKPAAVGQLVRLLFRLGVARLDVGQGRGELRHFDGIRFWPGRRMYVIDTVNRRGCQRMPKGTRKRKTRISTGLEAGFWMSQDFLGHGIGGDRWT